jgi:ferrous iron transport protein B
VQLVDPSQLAQGIAPVPPARPLRVALAGNPNSGKSTLFNGLTGGRSRVGNYPGVTVETRLGRWRGLSVEAVLGGPAEVLDVPGCYSLTARSPEEVLAIDTIRGRTDVAPRPDVVLDVVDATNLERNLYLTVQLMELRVPVVVVLTMDDLLERDGGRLDVVALEAALGVPVVRGGRGSRECHEELARAIERALANEPPGRPWRWSQAAAEALVAELAESVRLGGLADNGEADGLAHWLLAQVGDEADGGREAPDPEAPVVDAALRVRVQRTLDALTEHLGEVARGEHGAVGELIGRRYAWIAERVGPVVGPRRTGRRVSDRIDAVITHRVLGPAIFLGVMAVVFQLMFTWSEPLIGGVEVGIGALAALVRDGLPDGPLRDLLVQGVIAGVGNVLVFVPQIAILFALLALLNASGYLARAAYIMDRVMARVGLHGKAFVPLLTSFACAVPGIAATRTIESRRDRFVTILVAPLMTCSARLPVYALLIGVFFEASRPVAGPFTVGGLLLLGLYLAGLVGALGMAGLLRRTLFRGPRPPLILELPPYHRPRLAEVWRDVRENTWVFLRDAGTIILACTIVLWAVLSYPKAPAELEARYDAAFEELAAAAPAEDGDPEELARYETARRALVEARNREVVEHSAAGWVGSAVQPAFDPLGYDTRLVVSLMAAISAREVMVSALGVSYGVGEEVDEESVTLREALRGDDRMNAAVALSLLVWFVFAFQCVSTLAAVKRETKSWRWPAFLVVYQTSLAWVAAFVTYRAALWVGLG